MKQKMFVICSSIAALHLVIGGAVMLGGCSVVEPDEPMPPRAYIPEAKPVVEKTETQFQEKAPETIDTPKVEDPVVITTEPEKPVVLPPVVVKPVVKVPQKGDPAPTVSKKPFRANDIVYIVKKHDSYWGIARKFGVSMKDLIAYNTIAPNKLRPGHKIMIPASGKKVTKPAVKPASVKVKKSYAPIPADGIYVVKKNDSFRGRN